MFWSISTSVRKCSSFYFSNWSRVGKLVEHILYLDIHDLEMRMNDVYLDENYNFNSWYTNIHLVVYDYLKVLPICLNSLVPGRLTWKGNLDDIYTYRNGYSWLNGLDFINNTIDNNLWKWLCHHGIFQTNLCLRCNQDAKATLHSLRDCDFSILETHWLFEPIILTRG